MPKYLPDKIPEYMPDRMPEIVRDRMPDRVPIYASVYGRYTPFWWCWNNTYSRRLSVDYRAMVGLNWVKRIFFPMASKNKIRLGVETFSPFRWHIRLRWRRKRTDLEMDRNGSFVVWILRMLIQEEERVPHMPRNLQTHPQKLNFSTPPNPPPKRVIFKE